MALHVASLNRKAVEFVVHKKQGKTVSTWVESKRMTILIRLHIISQRQSYFETTRRFEQNKVICLSLPWWSFRMWKDWQISKATPTDVWLWQRKSVAQFAVTCIGSICWLNSMGSINNEDVCAGLQIPSSERFWIVCLPKWKSPHLPGYEIILCVDKR